MTPKNSSTTAADVAGWMLQEVQRMRLLYQDQAVYEIQRRFGDEFTYSNENGNPAIDRKVLAEFRKLTADAVVWERGQRMWRMRESYDSSGRQQD